MNIVEYEIPAARRPWLNFVGYAAAAVLLVTTGLLLAGLLHYHALLAMALAHRHLLIAMLSLGVVGITVNVVTYETPVAGTTPPNAHQGHVHQQVSAVITGDGSDTDFTVTHNFELDTDELAAGWPEVSLEYLLAAGYTAASLITSKDANTVVFSCAGFTGAGLRVRIKKPWSPER